MKAPLTLYQILLLFFAVLLLTQCQNRRSERREKPSAGQEKSDQQVQAEKIYTARTMGLAYLEEGSLEKAEEAFLELIELAPKEAIGYGNLGLVYLRMGRYEEAEKQLHKALELDPRDQDIRLNLAKVYEYSNESDKSIKELEKSVEIDPGHVQTLYTLAESYGGSSDKYSMQQWEKYMKKTVKATPVNIVPRLHLIEVLLRNGKDDEALEQLEELERIFPEFPDGAVSYYRAAMESLNASDTEGAFTNVLIFHNTLKLTNQYHSGIAELKGPTGFAVGTPVFSFSESASIFLSEGTTILEAIRFNDVTEAAGLELAQSGMPHGYQTHLALGDMDHDGDQDLYLGTWMENESRYRHFLFQSDMGRFRDISGEAGLKHNGAETNALFADYDNDGWFDLFVIAEGSGKLYKSIKEGKYRDFTGKANLKRDGKGIRALFFDMDHEGDLDLFISSSGGNSLLRNNGDGTFSPVAEKAGLEGPDTRSVDACFGDFDDDGDMDLFVVNQDAGNQLYFNQREGKFRNMTGESGLSGSEGSNAVACGDYNNDGYLDLFIAGNQAGSYDLFKNMGNGSFKRDDSFSENMARLEHTHAKGLAFFDFDNDGFLDLLISGKSTGPGKKGIHLLHNKGKGIFEDASHLLPEDLMGGGQIGIADYNEDGDLDIFLAGLNGGVRLLRNDGGNTNHRLQVRLVGIKTGSGKNNHHGIGCKIEVRAGDLYQMKVVTEPVIHFGLAQRSRADVVRILWTNGTPQNIFSPGADQDLVEEQQLKGSCPFLYAWNGDQFDFVKDIMWHSALGMPLGIMGGTTTYGSAEASKDYMMIPGEKLRPRNGKFMLQVTEELWETIYLDKAELIVLDHPDTIEVMVNEKFSPPPYPEHRVFLIPERIIPESAYDGKGRDILDLLSEMDDRYVANFVKTPYQGITGMREMILDPGPLENTGDLLLLLNGWIFPTDASINRAIGQSDKMVLVPPYLQVMSKGGEWKTVIDDLGFPAGKSKTVIADLGGKFFCDDYRVRIVTNMEIYWDQACFAHDIPEAPLEYTRLSPTAADHHYRGFSKMFRKGGRYGPHWFDYGTVTYGPRWRDLTGSYTRYGNVLELLGEADDMYIIANAGEETTIEFDEADLGELPAGWKRDFIIHTVGWVKDGDLNTAMGQTVEPLPFHGMNRYPYSGEEAYPWDRAHRRYHRKYNTREVSTSNFRHALQKAYGEEP
jgi:tetratricopeptide (TPR) repeat protein